MKAKLEFNLPEEKEDLDDALAAPRFRCVLSEMDNWLRSEIKYHDKGELQVARDKLHELMQDAGVEV